MTKPWEETWAAQRYVVEMAGADGHPSGRFLGHFLDDEENEDPHTDRSRANLAAAAPDMARLLLKVLESETTPYERSIRKVLRKAGVLPP